MHPYTQVRVGLSNADYDNVCEAYGGEYARLGAWRDLGDLLAQRVSWHFDLDLAHGEIGWHLGVLGEARLVITVADSGYRCYDHAQDESVICETVLDVTQWLDEREEAASEPSDMLRRLGQADDWAVFKAYAYKVYLTWSDGYFAASVPGFQDAAFGPGLAETLNGAAEMICRFFGAPEDLASQLTLTAELDEAATAHARGTG
jgi:hypothetical protein